MIYPTFKNINRLFVLPFKNGDDDNTREIAPRKIKQEAYEKLVEMSRNNDDTTGNFLDYSYH